jgi:hypothetical protein
MANLHFCWCRLKKSEGSMQSWDQTFLMPELYLKLIKCNYSFTLVCLQWRAILLATRFIILFVKRSLTMNWAQVDQ